MDSRAAAAPAIALHGVAQAIAGVGEHFHDIAVRTQQLDNGRVISEKRQQLAADFASFQTTLEKDPDPESRIQKTKDFLSQYKARIETPDVAPAVRGELLNHFDSFASNAMIGTAADSARLASKRATLALQNEVKTATDKGDRHAFETALATGREAGVILPEEEDRLDAEFTRALSGTTIDLALQKDPALVLEDTKRPDFLQNMPGFTPADLPRIQAAARVGMQRVRTEQMDLMEEALNTGHLTAKDLEAADYLTAGDVAQFKKALVKIDPPTAEQHGRAWDLLLANREAFADPSISDKDYADRWNSLRAEVIGQIPPAYRGDISQELSYRSPANRTAAKTKPRGYNEAPELKAIGLDRITRARNANLFGPVDDNADPVAKEKAFRRAEELRVQVARFIEENKDKATIDTVTDFTDKIITGDRVKSTASQFQSFVPGSAQRLRPAPTIPPLPPKSGRKDAATTDPMQIPPGTGTASDALLPPRTQLENFLK